MADQTPAPRRRPTITTVAQAAGVSIATVSRVMTGSPSVTPDLAARVNKVAAELSYRPSSAARGLALGSLRNVGVLLPDLGNAYFFDVVKQMHHSAHADGYRMLIADHTGDAVDELTTATDLLGQVDGLILLSSRIPASGLKQLARQSTPIVLVNRIELGVDIPMVAVDNFTPVVELCGKLAQFGHRRITYISGSDLAWQNRERRRGIEMAKVFGIEANTVTSDGTIEGAYRAVELALEHQPTALVCFNDLSALGAISRLRELGLSVPHDISVTGFDDIAMAKHLDPRLTTVKSPKTELGDHAWTLMAESLAGRQPVSPPLLTAELIMRDSTGPASSETK